jgi:protein tyrosine/serine phosphatase
MESIFPGDLAARHGRLLAWVDSLFIDHAVLRLLWTNWGTVVPGVMYRANHPTPGHLAAAQRRVGLRSLINLRGATRSGSDALSRERAGHLGLTFIDLPLSSGRAPSRETLLALAEALLAAPKPALLHCKSGADRAGFAAAVFLLLEGATVATALGQLSLRHGHLRGSRAGVLDATLLQFETAGQGHIPFLDWVRTRYDPDTITARFKSGGLAGFLHDRLLHRE